MSESPTSEDKRPRPSTSGSDTESIQANYFVEGTSQAGDDSIPTTQSATAENVESSNSEDHSPVNTAAELHIHHHYHGPNNTNVLSTGPNAYIDKSGATNIVGAVTSEEGQEPKTDRSETDAEEPVGTKYAVGETTESKDKSPFTSVQKLGEEIHREPEKDQEQHVMISYSWAQQETVLKVRDGLEKLGHKIWIDVAKMSGSVYDSMANAVENSKIVLTCVSKAYKDSDNCKLEAEYTNQTKKPFIPIIVEKGYKADGWLGLLLGAKLYFDFSDIGTFESTLAALDKEIKQKILTLKRTETSKPPSVKPIDPTGQQAETKSQSSTMSESSTTESPKPSASHHERHHTKSIQSNLLVQGATAQAAQHLSLATLTTATRGGESSKSEDIYQNHQKKVAFGSSFDPEKENNDKKLSKKKRVKKGRVPNNRLDKLTPENRLLLKEVGPKGAGRVSELKELLMEGADANCTDGDGISAIHHSVIQNRIACVKVLVNAGSNINKQAGTSLNTPLHEAVKLGPSGKDIVELLLENHAKTTIKNMKGLTAYEMAVKSDYNSLIMIFNAHAGKQLVDKMVKPRGQREKRAVVKHSSSESESEDDLDIF